jgi:hypothetical protein
MMRFSCLCGNTLSNAGSPNATEHFLIDSFGVEKLQDLADTQSAAQGAITEWAENWIESGAIEVWKCDVCKRLYFSPTQGLDKVVVYKVEQTGL